MIPRLMELTQYTYPSRLVFIQGTFMRDGFKTMLDWMIANANSTYFKNLKYFQVSEHNIQSSVNPEDAATLQTAILSDLKTICEDKEHFPLLETINLDNNGYNEGGGNGVSEFAIRLMQTCSANTGVSVSAWTNLGRPYTKMCSYVNDSYNYYDLNDERERAQCRYTWNWELKSGEREYAANGPFPNSENLQYCNTPAPEPDPTQSPSIVVPTTVAPTTMAPTTLPPPTAAPTEAPTTIPTTPTPEPWFPIYDPYILGDNCNYEKQTTCYWDVVKDDDVTRLYLAVRDAYPTKALAHTRVLALSGMTSLSLELFHESLSKQVKNEAPIDTYFYSDVLLSRSLNRELIPRLMELLQYTYPSRLVFIQGTFKREGFKTMLDWMIANAHHGYFKNLKYFQVSEHNIQSCVNASNTQALMTAILSDLKTICEDKEHFPLLETINLDNNGYNEGGGTDVSAFAMQLMQACPTTTGVKVSAWTNLGRPYTRMCGSVDNSYYYYDLDDEREIAQCRYTWNWELKSQYRIL
ncbi:hypothetical protein BLSTO_05540 [Blastocystis sp. subtype 1]